LAALGRAKAVNSIIAFWNAQAQARIRWWALERPAATSVKLLPALPSILLALAQGDDGRWEEIPAWQKNLFW
jgi:hypothetical protein